MHLPAMLRHAPLFSLRRGLALLAHTFRGSTAWSVLGLGDERKAFERYCAKRAAERRYIESKVYSWSLVEQDRHVTDGAAFTS